ncbi:MAG: sulfurtransferase TusA family protein [Anaerolineae bacterium]|nr:sulfurtransferase TusA family protein [Anaerolineae bacterium]
MSANILKQPRTADGLLDRYWLPKIALVFISIASLLGVLLTMMTHGASWELALVRWLHMAGLGALAGGAMWWGWFVRRPSDEAEVSDVARFALAQKRRFRAIGIGALLVVVLTAPQLMWFDVWSGETFARGLWFANIAALLLAIIFVIRLFLVPRDDAHAFDAGAARLALVGLVATLALTATLDARLTFPSQPLAWLLRPVHVVAFALWFGGAIWNIFIAVPAARETLALPVVVSAAEQLERFRVTVRIFLPTLVITGLLQAYAYTGLNLQSILFSSIGQLVLVKLGLVVGLIVIFITCPLWRACSPIKGMCDLEDLHAPALPTPTRRMDNRGKGCAGFVQIQKMLEGMGQRDVLELLSTDRISWWELPAWLEKHGHQLLAQERQGRWLWQSYRFLIQKGAGELPRTSG